MGPENEAKRKEYQMELLEKEVKRKKGNIGSSVKSFEELLKTKDVEVTKSELEK